MKLYDTPLAPNPRRVRWFMAEKGIEDIEIVPLNLIQGDHKTPDYLERAGLPNVPALEMDDGTTITESVAICRYLESRYPEPNLFGRTPEETAVIEMARRFDLGPLVKIAQEAPEIFVVLNAPHVACVTRTRRSRRWRPRTRTSPSTTRPPACAR